MKAACGACGAPTGDQATLCRDCYADLRLALAAAAALAPDLEIARSRQARMAAAVGGGPGRVAVLPYDERAARAADALAAELAGWVRVLGEMVA